MKNIATYVTLLGLLWTQTLLASRISLTASDGTGLELHKLEARVVLDGFLALTELSMVFYNPENRWPEGRFQKDFRISYAGKSQGIVAPLNHSKIIHKLTSPVYTDSPITVSGSTWHWPEKVETLQINEPLIVFAEIENKSVDVPPSDIADLEEFVANVKKEAKSKAFIIGPYPVGCTFPFYYEANGRRDPFTPFDSDEEREANTSAPLAE